MIVFECRITQPEAKNELRGTIAICVFVSFGWKMIVKHRQLSDTLRKRNWQASGRIVISKKRFRDGASAKFAGIPGFQNHRHMRRRPGNGQRKTTGKKLKRQGSAARFFISARPSAAMNPNNQRKRAVARRHI